MQRAVYRIKSPTDPSIPGPPGDAKVYFRPGKTPYPLSRLHSATQNKVTGEIIIEETQTERVNEHLLENTKQ